MIQLSYVSFSLKYRPQRFEDLVGQEHVSRTLMNAVTTERVHHAYLFSGPRGTGKTSTARVLAKALNCVQGPTPTPCGECEFCVAVRDNRALDVIEIDAASNRGIDEIRDLREKVKYSPAEARSKVYILDEVHMLTTEAFNALLKTLEEPPAHSFFVLATTEPHKVPATILSRCQRFDFRPISVPQIARALQMIAQSEGIEAEPSALNAIARAADGGMRDAESILDQVVAYSEDAVTLEIVNSVLGVTEADTLAAMADVMARSDVAASFALVDGVVSSGKDVAQLMADLTIYMRDLLRISLDSEPAAWSLQGEEGQNRMREQARSLGPDRLMEAIHKLAQAQTELRQSTQPGLVLELTLAGLSQPAQVAPVPTVAAPKAPPAAPASRQPSQTQTPAPAPQPAPAAPGPPTQPAAPQPPPQPQMPPAQPVVSGGDLTLATIQAHWGEMPGELKRMARLPVGAFVREGVPTDFASGKLTLTFGKQYEFHYNQVAGPYRETVELAVERLYGQKLSVEPRLAAPGEDVQPAAATPTRASQPAPQEQPSAPAPPVPQPAPEPPAAEPQEQSPAPAVPVADEMPPPAPQEASAAQHDTPSAQTDDGLQTAVSETLGLFEGSREIDGDD